jgi:peptidoglycan hydrolase CwlO-like protein
MTITSKIKSFYDSHKKWIFLSVLILGIILGVFLMYKFFLEDPSDSNNNSISNVFQNFFSEKNPNFTQYKKDKEKINKDIEKEVIDIENHSEQIKQVEEFKGKIQQDIKKTSDDIVKTEVEIQRTQNEIEDLERELNGKKP